MEQEEKKQDDELARELEAQQKQWETEKTRGRGAARKKIARELGEIEITSQIKQKREQGEEEKHSKRAIKRRRKYKLVGAKWGEQKENLLLNKMREQTLEQGAENIVEGAPLPTMLPPQRLDQGAQVNGKSTVPPSMMLPTTFEE